jgi:acid phosphatase (class B)
MRRRVFVTSAALAVLNLCGCAAPRPPETLAVAAPAAAGPSERQTVEEYIASYTLPPGTVGFDVDDTALFTSYGFVIWAHKTGDPLGVFAGIPDKSPPDRPEIREKRLAFWKAMNSELDRYSMPKRSAQRLVAFHVARGDRVVFVTGRPPINAGVDGP